MSTASATTTPSVPSAAPASATCSTVDRPMRVMWVPSTGTVIDAVHPETGRGVYSRQSIAEIRNDPAYREAVIAELPTIRGTIVAAERQRWAFPPRAISRARYEHLRTWRTPQRWCREGDAMTFHLADRVTDRLAWIVCRIGSQCFELCDNHTMSHADVVQACRRAARSQPGPPVCVGR